MTLEVHQLVPSLLPHDAVGNHTFHLREVLRSMGYRSEIFAMFRHELVADDSYPAELLPSEAHAVIYQFSNGSPVAERWAKHSGYRLINYHNMTPVEFLGDWDPWTEVEMAMGRHQIAEFATVCDHAICDSDFNRSELDALGYPSTETIPVLFDMDPAPTATIAAPAARQAQCGLQVLFVGRLVPNKAQHELIAVLAVLRDSFGEDAHLHLVGTDGPLPYRKLLEDLVRTAGLEDHVTFHGPLSRTSLVNMYRAADVFLCLSDHEGFCVPVLEAMHHGLPVVAYDHTAVGDTVGNGGLLLKDKRPVIVAAALSRVAQDRLLYGHLVRAGKERAAGFALELTADRFKGSLTKTLPQPGGRP